MNLLLSSMGYLSPFTTISILLLCVSHIKAANFYQLDTSYSGSTFFNGFNFFTGPDPTNGFVNYLDAASALGEGYAVPDYLNSAAYMGVDHVTTLTFPGTGRKSVRISSQKSWTHGLFISDIAHMPGGICGTWPAHWTLGPNWPTNGEIDIIEGVNSAQQNLMSLHTSPGCTMVLQSSVGTPENTNCNTAVNNNAGCNIKSSSTTTYGAQFNADGGGVYATQWTSDAITIWFFPRGNIPADISNGNPDPSTWPAPQGVFGGGPSCDIDTHFAQNQIIFDTTFCGDYGDATWSTDNVCRNLATSCEKYVAGNPGAFTDAYWLVNSVKVYTLGPAPSSTAAPVNIPTSAANIPAPTKIASSAVNSPPVNSPPVNSPPVKPVSSSTKNALISPTMSGPAVQSPLLSSSAASLGVSNRNVPSSANLPAPSHTTSYRSSNTPIPLTPAIKYIGCLSNPLPFTNFLPTRYSDRMNYDICFARCKVQGYAGLYDGECFCAHNLDLGRNKPFPRADCNIPCPGARTEICGGLLNNGERGKREDNAALSKEKGLLLMSVFEIPDGAIVAAEEPCPEDEALSLPAFELPSNYHIYGCIGSHDNFLGFNYREMQSYTSFGTCIKFCRGTHLYIATGPTGCYCGDRNALENHKNYVVDTVYCNNPCPMHEDQICGGKQNPRSPFSKPEFVIYSYQKATQIGDYQDFACVGSFANFVGFRHIPRYNPTLEFCFEACKKVGNFPSQYVAAWSTGCYCADDDDFAHNPNNFDMGIRFCDVRCQGTNVFCGGYTIPSGADPRFLLLVYVYEPYGRRALGSRSEQNDSNADLRVPDVLAVTANVECADCNPAGDFVFLGPALDDDIAVAAIPTPQL